MRRLYWTTGRVVILGIYSFGLGVGSVFMIDDLHAGTFGISDSAGILAIVAVLVVIIVGAARDSPDEVAPEPPSPPGDEVD